MTNGRTVGSVVNELVKRSNSEMRRLRILEQDNEVFRTRINSLEQGMLAQSRQIKGEFAAINSRINKLDSRITKMEATLKEMVKQMKLVATKADISGFEELVEIYNPLTSKFVTREEVQEMIAQKK